MIELDEAFKKKRDIPGLGETRKKNEKIIELKSSNIPFHKDNTKGQKGVRFLVNKKWGKIPNLKIMLLLTEQKT